MLVYTIVGLAVGIAGTLIVSRYAKSALSTGKKAGALILWIIGLVAIGFAVDWAYACYLEVEMQSAAMGLLIFGGIGVILAVIGYRVGRPKKGEVSGSEERAAASEA